MPRPIKLTSEIHDRIVRLIKLRNFRETAAAAAGVDPRTLRNWLKRGAQGRQPFKKFAEDMAVAEAEAEAMDVAEIAQAGKDQVVEVKDKDGNVVDKKILKYGDWRATAWRLERRHPDRWATTQKHEHSGPGGSRIQIDLTRLSDDELARLAAGDASVVDGAEGD